MVQNIANPEDKFLRRAILITIALVLLYLLWNVLLAIAVVVIGVLIAARFGTPILRFFTSLWNQLRRNF